ncbi:MULTISPECIES: D-alanine--D-alanine ligase [Thalassospira]|jgi:D-alanine-D-alanine ligase|uniref:D-alanine--D-alanine ligase n=1 Tax=Thalassospira xiamenensis TaxID=220697 RepID=A0ABR5Y2Q2_9PROT|nr:MULTISPECIES: D-alanine--D-alanine ligase [Thalassospira]KZD03111.1 D-alanine--D-alanine ligase [Thalassospira xiamenensis]KZD06109.1 D-alanine--D-alanine ligase [Thalassospira xiamenensis]MAB35639.1 D-alanine--D-alanine ligase [Thalassospira sp.]MAL29048.1 D-alanine--D-alanine ligase [Thalassospira sp.]MBL4839980.1 D-alanine--D-alanine ligase [Thalassospira sp.]|tara:strand:- start:34 stop:948 length:915 start_codon:yes stop_codon:yes gene_type:complete
MSKHVAVIYGGWSAERPVSLSSGTECIKALREKGYRVTEIDAGRDLAAQLAAIDPKPDVVFNALHGRWGEDGCVQGLLEIMGIPYTHSGVRASSIAMDKMSAKAMFMEYDIPCARHVWVSRDEIASGNALPPPYVLKPNNEGSSVGVEIILTPEEEQNMLAREWMHGDGVMQEEFIPGREMTVAVKDGKAMEIIEIMTGNHAFYDFESKYVAGGSEHIIPADIPGDLRAKIQDCAEKAYRALGCRGIARADFRYDPAHDRVAILEINTQPGMTPTSLVPDAARHDGLSFADIVAWMVEDASCER